MKKIIIITAILLLGISVHAQRSTRERTRQKPEKQKSETAVRRSAEQQNGRAQQAHRARQATARDISHASRSRTGPAKSHPGNRSTGSRSRAMKSSYEKPGKGQVHRGSTVNKDRTPRDRSPNTGRTGTYRGQKPTGSTGRYNGYKSPGNRETVHRNNNGQRNNQSIRGNSGNRKPNARPHTKRTPVEHRKHYTTPNRRVIRTNHVKNYHYRYNPVRYRNVHYHYHAPKRIHVTWTNRMYRDYRVMYPEYRYWYYPIGYQIVTIPFYHAYHHVGEVRNVYGRVHEVYYSWSTDEYHLYFGGNYPYHDFTVIISGRHARRFDRYPEMFFEGRYMWVTGLLSTFEGRPELIVKRRHQIHLY